MSCTTFNQEEGGNGANWETEQGERHDPLLFYEYAAPAFGEFFWVVVGSGHHAAVTTAVIARAVVVDFLVGLRG